MTYLGRLVFQTTFVIVGVVVLVWVILADRKEPMK